MIYELDKATWNKVNADRDIRLSRLLSTDPLDEAMISAAVKRCYNFIGQPEPEVVWVDGPTSVLAVADASKNRVSGRLCGHLGLQLWERLWSHLGRQLSDPLWDHFWDHLGDHFWDHFGDQCEETFEEEFKDQIYGPICLGWWFAHSYRYKAISRLPGIDPLPEDLQHRLYDILTVLQCPFWLPLEGVSVMSRKHTATNGNEWEWPDGTTIHALKETTHK